MHIFGIDNATRLQGGNVAGVFFGFEFNATAVRVRVSLIEILADDLASTLVKQPDAYPMYFQCLRSNFCGLPNRCPGITGEPGEFQQGRLLNLHQFLPFFELCSLAFQVADGSRLGERIHEQEEEQGSDVLHEIHNIVIAKNGYVRHFVVAPVYAEH